MKGKQAAPFVIMVVFVAAVVLTAAIVSMNGDEENGNGNGVDEGNRLELGLDLETKTMGWAVTQGIEKAREWRDDAKLVYLEWRNCNDNGIMDESSAVDLYYSSPSSEKYWKVVVDDEGATDYELGAVERSKVYEENQNSFVFNWTYDSDVILTKAKNHFRQDGEELVRMAVLPRANTEIDLGSGNNAIVLVYTTDQDIYFDGNSGEVLEQIVIKM